MPIEQSVTEVLDEAIQSLIALDLSRLERLEERVAALTSSGGASEAIFAKKRLLKMLLQNCRSNLDALNRLHSGHTGEQWAH